MPENFRSEGLSIYPRRESSAMKERLLKLFTVKSIVTVMLTGVFAYLSINGKVNNDQFITIFTTVIAFYFGTQAEKKDKY